MKKDRRITLGVGIATTLLSLMARWSIGNLGGVLSSLYIGFVASVAYEQLIARLLRRKGPPSEYLSKSSVDSGLEAIALGGLIFLNWGWQYILYFFGAVFVLTFLNGLRRD